MPKFHLYTQLLGRFRKDGNPWIWQERIVLEHLTDQMNYNYYCLNPDEYTLGERELYKIAHGNKVADKKEAQMMGDGAFDVDDRDEFVVPYGFSLLALSSQTASLSNKYGFIHLVLPSKSAKWLTVKLVIDDKLARSVTQLLGHPLLLDVGAPPTAKAPPPGCFLECPIRPPMPSRPPSGLLDGADRVVEIEQKYFLEPKDYVILKKNATLLTSECKTFRAVYWTNR